MNTIADFPGRCQDGVHRLWCMRVCGVRRHVGPNPSVLGAIVGQSKMSVCFNLGQGFLFRVSEHLV